MQKSEMPPCEFCPISEDWKLVISNLVRMSVMKCYWILLDAKVAAFTVSELLTENQQGLKLPPKELLLSTLCV